MDGDHTGPGYTELFRLASANGLQELEVSVLQIPSDANQHHAVVLASARTARGLFRAVGEAQRASVPEPFCQELLTVAEIRAKSYVLAEAAGLPRSLPGMMASAAAPGATPAHRSEAARSSSAAGASAAASASSSARPVEPPEVKQAPPPGNKRTADEGEEAVKEEGSRVTAQPAQAGASTTAQERQRPATRPAVHVVPSEAPTDGLGPEIVARLLQMTRRKALLEGADSSEEAALRKLDSFFQRAFGHPMAEATRTEGQRVVTRLASDLAGLSAERGDASSDTGS